MKKRTIIGAVLAIAMSMIAVDVFADSGGWISGGTTGGGGSSSGGGGGGGGGCSGDAGYYDLWCQGYSWIFYKYVGGASNSSAINFRKDKINNEIAKSCSEHGETGGFWHLGYNMRALNYNGIGYFGDFTQNNGFYSSGYTYSTSPGSYGHAQTFDYNTIKNEYSYVYNERYITHSNSSLSHDIYKNGIKMYTASRYGSESEVLKAYQQAYGAIYPNSNKPTALPDNVYAFCWWPDMDGSSFQGTSRVMKGNNSWDSTPSNERMQPDPLWYPYLDNASQKVVKQKTANTLIVQDCDPIDGCLISFRHYLIRNSGNDSTRYTIKRTINGVDSIINNNVENNGVNDDNLIQLHPVTILPGQKVCETLSFYSDGKSEKASTTVCAAAVVARGAELGVEIRDQKSSVKYQDWRKDYVYAKPTDNIDIRGIYTPYYQDMYGLTLPGKSKTNGFINNGKTIGATFNAGIDPDWNNVFSIRLGEEDCRKNIVGSIGESTQYGENDIYSYKVTNNSVGKQDVRSVTNACVNTENTPKQVSLTYSDKDWFAATVDLNAGESNAAEIYVPYNFINETNIVNTNDIVYAGEKTSVPYSVTTKLKFNGELNDTYATVVDGAEWKLEYCYGSQNSNCHSVDGASGQKLHNKGGSDNYIYEEETVNGDSTIARFNVPDVPAGTKMWIRSAVYPKDSGTDGNIREDYYDKNNPDSWAYSNWAELTVAKKPSFQVWGGSIYSAGDLELLASEKQHVDGYNDFNDILNNGGPFYVFGSWAELSLVANGKVSGFSSGAGTGFSSTEDARLAWGGSGVSGLGGSEENPLNYCARNALSFANMNCSKNVVGEIEGGNTRSDDKSVLISRFADEIKVIDGDTWNGPEEAETGTNVYRSDGDLKITQDIKYTDGKNYSNLKEIPKTIIYVKGNILINCKVERVDAVLIADGNINDCYDSDNINAEKNSTQLKINGSVIADTLTLKRTYGAATGYNTVIPAEIINYDTSLYIWANGESDVVKSGKIVTAYQQELSPRY